MVDVGNYNNAYDTMQVSTTTLNQGNNVKIVKPKPKRYKAWDLEKERIISFTNLYGRSAKRLYRQYIDAGFDAGMLMPNDLQYYPISGLATNLKLLMLANPLVRHNIQMCRKHIFKCFF